MQQVRLFTEEDFSPNEPIVKFDAEEEASALANDTAFDQASFSSISADRASLALESLEAGMDSIKTGAISFEIIPFGGTRKSDAGDVGLNVLITGHVD
ncbi:aldehyde dehydrogenase family protein [Paraburkholderia fungorum]|uniref:aldehyde dehydrogenase family protein n=1 Tax=Paraburkholderia fungorum TaxID=134537 RepID=UPI000627029C|nr:aldehyde dehydrogenase family protein [Paraburkholderia fungorum]